ncbi:5-dehydro-2-deoxygluconokinase [Actinoplanes ianthinogenes]|uniref:5-dehydro-2-deoxygluconokinase n=1 Tax=Actinoplanes ianthinogenes TaxID=122358 RepID=A0ABM7M523_9ACTN|nr:5-dehydro-2-deoxygluconokinase [Actinoplanes ianthinogenes]BCJ46730.1 5-dehydro-2-deoxygluconokinase [Actinoplanes ianthinogenes]GGR16025.1 5-dehydro-2-deoxygluconokinase [Actinoplanes ianthinogenes]
MPAYEVLTMGRIGVDLYPEQAGVGLAEVRTFAKFLGGSPSNVAVAAARYGRRAAVITRVGADPFGEYLRLALRGFGVDDRFVGVVDGLPTPVTFCEIFPPDRFPLYFYRYPKAPDIAIFPDELDMAAIRAAGVFWVTGTGLSAEPSREATLTALKNRDKSGITVFDLDWRPMFWDSPAREIYAEALAHTTVAVGNLDEVEIATGTRDPEAAAAALLESGVELAVIKQGPAGVIAVSRTERARSAPVRVEVVNGLGAGDAFGGALCHGLLHGWPLPAVLDFANAAGALVAGRLACADAMPAEHEVRDLLGAGHG